MLLIVIALHCEARLLIELLGLKRDYSATTHPIFYGSLNDTPVRLIESGVGKLKSAIATTHLLTGKYSDASCSILNFGICGSTDPTKTLGSIWVPNKVVDFGSKREYFPDILVRHPFQEVSLVTFDRPVAELHSNTADTNNADINDTGNHIVDMEGSGFFEAARCYISPDRIHILKLVSDHCDGTVLNPSGVESLIAPSLQVLQNYLETICGKISHNTSVLTSNESKSIRTISEKLKLSVYQRNEFGEKALAYKVRTGNLEILANFQDCASRTKSDRSELLHALYTALMSDLVSMYGYIHCKEQIT